MSKSSPHKRWKGCCLMCADNRGKVRGMGRRWRDPFKVRKQVGKSRRLSRRFVPDQD